MFRIAAGLKVRGRGALTTMEPSACFTWLVSMPSFSQATADFPRDEMYGLTSQIRRSCASIPANIAEGCRRRGDTEFARFLRIAMGSASELEYHILLAHDLSLLETADYERLNSEATEIKRMLTSFIRFLKPGG